ncbi:hypothetical protein SAY86_009638 [Trapa natans]|uniref:Uncharacterized protein n=1 Tax=Trapa natans TaxID=22666 RepID=A0AAN7KR88_TRANT|nr:hypothetical protein SAY86_009638 [Trapa natans]
MIHKNKRAILLLLLVCVAAALDIGEDQSTIHITVWNDLLPGRKFIIHCKSKDDDLGAITVPPSVSILTSSELRSSSVEYTRTMDMGPSTSSGTAGMLLGATSVGGL